MLLFVVVDNIHVLTLTSQQYIVGNFRYCVTPKPDIFLSNSV